MSGDAFDELVGIEIPNVQGASSQPTIEKRAIDSDGEDGITVLQLGYLRWRGTALLTQTPQFDHTIASTGQEHLFCGCRFDQTSDQKHGVHVSMMRKEAMVISLKVQHLATLRDGVAAI